MHEKIRDMEIATASEKADCVALGIRPVASLIYHSGNRRDMDDAAEAHDSVATYHVELAEGWSEVYLYRKDRLILLEVIKATLGKEHDTVAFMHWVRGKMFGFEDSQIRDTRPHGGADGSTPR